MAQMRFEQCIIANNTFYSRGVSGKILRLKKFLECQQHRYKMEDFRE